MKIFDVKLRADKGIYATNNVRGFDDDGTGTLASDPSNDYAYDAFGNMTKDEKDSDTGQYYKYYRIP